MFYLLFYRSTVASLLLNKHLHINGINKGNVKVTDDANRTRNNNQSSTYATSGVDHNFERRQEEKSDCGLENPDQISKLLDSSRKHTLLFSQKFDSFPKPKGSIKTTLSIVPHSYSPGHKYRNSLSNSVPNLSVNKSPNVYTKNNILRAMVNITKAKEMHENNFEKIVFTTVEDDHYCSNSKYISKEQNLTIDEKSEANNLDNTCRPYETLPLTNSNEKSILDGSKTLPITQIDATNEDNGENSSIPTTISSTMEKPMTSTVTNTTSEIVKSSKTATRFAKLTKSSKNPMILRVGKNSNGQCDQIKFNKRRFLGAGKENPFKDDKSPERIPGNQMASEEAEGEDRKKQASLHKMKRERKVSNHDV